MDSNRDDAEICLDLARKALASGDMARAKRLLAKSERMYSKQPLADAQAHLSVTIATAAPRRQAPPPPRARAPSPPPVRKPTAAMAAVVARVVAAPDHYAALDVARGASADDVRRAYRRLALSLHPDKNVDPRAGDAFKRVSRASEVLGDPERRRMYDAFGCDDEASAPAGDHMRGAQSRTTRRRRRGGAAGRARHGGAWTPEHELDELLSRMSPEEVFEFLFTAAGEMNGSGRRRPTPHGGDGSAQHAPSLWTQFRPLTLLATMVILLFMFSSGMEDIPQFSLEPSFSHSLAQKTPCSIPFYVSRFLKNEATDARTLSRLHDAVHQSAARVYASSCESERARYTELVRWSNSMFSLQRSRERYARMAADFKKRSMHGCRYLEALKSCLLEQKAQAAG